MKFRFIWDNDVIQIKQLIVHKCTKSKEQYFTMNSPIYEAIENGTFCIDLGFGRHSFKIEEI